MPVRVGFLSTAHMHSYGYAHGLKGRSDATLTGVWDPDGGRARAFAERFETQAYSEPEKLIADCDALIVTSENVFHAEHASWALAQGKPVLCEKPLAVSPEQAAQMAQAATQGKTWLMTAFPCRYSPAFARLIQRVQAGEIGSLRAVCATNRGSCPFGWFTHPDLSGGGAMIDHVVHVADLLSVLLGGYPERVRAQIGHNMYSESWEDTAMLTLDYPGGVFATLDSSWSRPKAYKTWGDVTMNVIGDAGVIELDMFGQELDVYRNEDLRHQVAGFGSDLDAGLVSGFLNAIQMEDAPPITLEDGWRAAAVALAGYASVREGQPVAPSYSLPI